MRKSRISWPKQVRLMEHFVAGTTARCASILVGVNKSSAAYYFQRIREIIAYQLEQESYEIFDGEIEGLLLDSLNPLLISFLFKRLK